LYELRTIPTLGAQAPERHAPTHPFFDRIGFLAVRLVAKTTLLALLRGVRGGGCRAFERDGVLPRYRGPNSARRRRLCGHDPSGNFGMIDTNYHNGANGVGDAITGDVNFSSVIPSVSIEALLVQRAAIIERFRKILSLYDEIRALAQAGRLGIPQLEQITVKGIHRELPHDTALLEAIRSVDRNAWQSLMSESGLRTFMDSSARKKWDDAVYGGEFPELTAKIIIEYFLAVYGSGKSQWCTHRPERLDELDDLIRVFCVFDGKPEPDHRQGIGCLLPLLISKGVGTWEGEYFKLQWYKKGTAHLTFKRTDLVDQLNRILARRYPGALPSPNGSR
jgi:hypothetical protein